MSALRATGTPAVWRHWTHSRPANKSRIHRCIKEHMLPVSILLLLKALFSCAETEQILVQIATAALLLSIQHKATGCMHIVYDCQLGLISTKHDAHAWQYWNPDHGAGLQVLPQRRAQKLQACMGSSRMSCQLSFSMASPTLTSHKCWARYFEL